MKQLHSTYNAAAVRLGKPLVKRFADHKLAERRVAAILAEMPASNMETVLALLASRANAIRRQTCQRSQPVLS